MKTRAKRDILFALYLTCMTVVNLVGTKISCIAGIRVSVGILFMPFLFVISDIISEVYGKKEAGNMVNISTGMLVFTFFAVWVCIAMPENGTWGLQKEFETVFAPSLRMTAASVVSFFISQKLDVKTFHFLKCITNSKYLFIRNNVSTVISQFFDTVIFMYLAFWKVSPKFTFGFIFSLVIPYWIFKVVFAVLETPFCYLGVRWLRQNGDLPVPDSNGNV